MAFVYEHPYPSPAAALAHPFVPLEVTRLDDDAMRAAGRAFLHTMQRRRSVRSISDDPVPREVIDLAIEAASTAPSGAHQQPWTFVVVGDRDLKRQIRLAAEEEEVRNYQGGRMNAEWQQALGPLGTDAHKEFLEAAPWLVILFEQRHGVGADGGRLHHYYVKESCGIAAGLVITALHHVGLVTLTHTPSPMAFLTRLLGRPDNERPFVLFPVGHPTADALVPDLQRKALAEVMVTVGS